MIELSKSNVASSVGVCVFTSRLKSLRGESDWLNIVVEHKWSVDLDQVDVIDCDAGIEGLQTQEDYQFFEVTDFHCKCSCLETWQLRLVVNTRPA